MAVKFYQVYGTVCDLVGFLCGDAGWFFDCDCVYN